MSELLMVGAAELGRRIRAGQVSPLEVVEAHIARIERVNPSINALVADRFEAARHEARAAGETLANTDPETLPPLFGVPVTVKELIAVRGMPWTAGVHARRDKVGQEDAPLVARLKAGGAIVLGVTNVSEAGLWLETYNVLYGRTKNPWNTDHIAGGSTGGEAALIAAGGSPLGIGADIGGSIRNPCFFNGIAGHKPTGGFIPSSGHWPPAEGARGRYCVSGPMARTVEDLEVAMGLFSPESDAHRDADRDPFAPLASLDPAETTVYWFDDNGLARVHPEVAQNLEDVAAALSARGFKTERWRPEGITRSAEFWGAVLTTTGDEGPRELLGDGDPIPLVPEWLKLPFGRATTSFHGLFLATFESVASAGANRTRKLAQICLDTRDRIEAKLGPRGVLISPPYPRPAPRHHRPVLQPLAFSYCGAFNVMELPGTAVRTGFSKDGLPLGVQVVGSRFSDALTLAVARELETALGGWAMAPA